MKTISISPSDSNELSADRAQELLDQVNFKTFQATPQAVQPFQSSVLRWQVEAPKGVIITLDGSSVTKSGTKTVQPSNTQTFRLFAGVGRRFTKFLASVTITVNLDQCISIDSSEVDELLAGALTIGVTQSSDVYFRLIQLTSLGHTQFVQSKPEVTMSPGRIRFKLKLAGRATTPFPDPDIDVDASFGLALLSPSLSLSAFPKIEISPTDVEVSVNVSFPWWAYLTPVAYALPTLIRKEEERARLSFTSAIDTMVAKVIVPFFDRLEPPGKEKHAVRISSGYFGGTVTVDFCPALPSEVVTK
jgi:hypothetical protein